MGMQPSIDPNMPGLRRVPVSGSVMCLLEAFVRANVGADGLYAVLERAGLLTQAPWIAPLTYSAREFDRLLHETAHQLGLPRRTVYARVGRWSAPRLIRRYGALTSSYHDPIELLSAMPGTLLHELSVRIGMASDAASTLTVEVSGGGSATLRYARMRIPDALVDGLLVGLGDAFDLDCSLRHRRPDGSTRLEHEISVQYQAKVAA